MTAFAVSAREPSSALSARDLLRPEIARVEALLKAYTARRRDEQPEVEREKYWLLTDQAVDRFLSQTCSHPHRPGKDESAWLAEYEQLSRHSKTSAESPARILAKNLRLSRLELDALLLCGLPDLDFRFRQWFQLLQGDASRCHLHVWRVLDILEPACDGSEDPRTIFEAAATLRRRHLIALDQRDSDDGLFASVVRADERILAFLLDRDCLDSRLSGILSLLDEPAPRSAVVDTRLHLFSQFVKTQCFQGAPVRALLLSTDARRTSRAAKMLADAAQLKLFEFDCSRAISATAPWLTLVELAFREASLDHAALVFRNASVLAGPEPQVPQLAVLVEAIGRYSGLVMLELTSAVPNGQFPLTMFVPLSIPAPAYEDRLVLWRGLLQTAIPEADGLADHLAGTFLLTEDQMESAVAAARNLARRDSPFSSALTPAALLEACRYQTSRRLVAMAQRLEPRPGLSLDDVVLPDANYRQLEELRNRIRRRRQVHSAMGYEHRMRLGRGMMALFAGPSGTGKTMAAEVLASEQGCDLYKVDLSAVVSKWVGETEKNLNRIFDDAEQCHGMLFFDEADALFGQRGEVKEARDRWANLEVNFLLQRIEEFSGIVILATNLRTNIDAAFSRRFHSVVDFPQPDEHARHAIWKRTLPGDEFCALGDRELRIIAARFDLTGGGIRNAVLDASYRATEDAKKIELRHVAAAAAREYQKMGRPVTRSEFGEDLYQIALEEVLAPSRSATAS